MAEVLEFNQMFYTNFEPKTKNRFVLEIDGIPSYLCKVTDRPSITFEEIVLDHINLKRKLKGKGTWNDINLQLYDPIVPSGAQAVMEWVRLSHESLTGRDGYAEFYKKDVDLKILGPVGDVVELWKIKGAFIKDAKFNQMDWSSGTDVMMIDVILAMDYCVLEY
jgi:hypothetical protein